jgi:ATP-dependent Lhr-like helicase
VLGFPEDRAAFVPGDQAAQDRAAALFGTASERSLTDLSQQGIALPELTRRLWELAWTGAVSATTFGPLRQGIRSDFEFELADKTTARRDRGGFQRWSAARSSGGLWRRWLPTSEMSPVERLEDTKRRARLVLDRYGIVFRALLSREGPGFQWRELFPAFRLMELSGEIMGGVFWDSIPGLQFALPEALRDRDVGDTQMLWIQHAQDPVSLCGLGLEVFQSLPKRVQGTWLWWRGAQLVGVVSASGKKLEFPVALTSQELSTLTKRMAGLLLPEGKAQWTLETIEGMAAADHPYSTILRETGFHDHGSKLIYWRT